VALKGATAWHYSRPIAGLQHVWGRQSVWSQTANKLKAELGRSRSQVLGLTIAGAVLTTAAVVGGLESAVGKALAGMGAFAVALAGTVRARAGKDATQNWTRARSVAEGIKSETYLYTTSSDGYAGADRNDRLDTRIAQLERDANDLVGRSIGIEPVSREAPKADDAETYVAERLTPQVNWYRSKARELRGRRGQIGRIQLALSVLAAALAALAGAVEVEQIAVWVPVVTTVAATIAAYSAAERYDYLLVEYQRTADELERLRDRRPVAMSDDDFVQACEAVISTQNDGWMAKLSSDEPPPAGA